jgi:hypothetical protein
LNISAIELNDGKAMQRPETLRNEPKWIKDCTKIRARAVDLIDGKTSLIDAALAPQKLAACTHAQSDPDLLVFNLALGDLLGLPIGSERSFWSPHALARDDLKIKAVVDKWQQPALDAVKRLADPGRWRSQTAFVKAAVRRWPDPRPDEISPHEYPRCPTPLGSR